MDTIKPLFTATATATGGRNGHTEASDGSVRADLVLGRGGVGFARAAHCVVDPSLPQADLEALAKEAHEKICPYSNATRNNVDVQLEIKGS